MSRIVSLQIDNVKRISAVHITPDPEGNLVIVGGNNEQGKSSVLDSIAWALGGAKQLPDQPIHAGADRAKIVADLGDLIVTRVITPTGSTLTVKGKSGGTYNSPQAILDKLTGKLSFDPLAFTTMKAADQLEALKKLVGLDFTEIDAQRKTLFDERTVTNRDLEKVRAVFDSLPYHDGAPTELVKLSEILADQARAEAHNKAVDDAEKAASEARNAVFDAQQVIETDRELIAEVDAEIAKLQEKRAELVKHAEDQRAVVAAAEREATAAERVAAEMQRADLAPIKARLADVEVINEKVRANQKHRETEADVDRLTGKAADLTAAIEKIDADKKAMLAAAKFPVPDLSFNEGGIIYKGFPFAQASTAVKIKVSVAMAAALNPELKVMLIRNGSDLDQKSLALIAQLAAEHDLQVWIERVSTGSECSVIIEDGRVLGTETAAA